ncbi:MAG: YbhB/YbcL family Raf kinase inhibitor-like protein [Anaerolineae bacterium]
MSRKWCAVLECGVALLLLAACGAATPAPTPSEGGAAMALKVESPAFSPGGDIPRPYTCDGPDLSPPLRWSEPPAGTQSLALICDDPDAPAGTWVHWVLYRIPATVRELPEGVPKRDTLADGSRQGRNDFGKVGYGGPCPPRGPKHRYFFKVYALDVVIDLPPGATKAELLKAMEGHVLAQGELMGRYGR